MPRAPQHTDRGHGRLPVRASAGLKTQRPYQTLTRNSLYLEVKHGNRGYPGMAPTVVFFNGG